MATEDGPVARWARRKAASRKRTGATPALEEPPSVVPAARDTADAPAGDGGGGKPDAPAPDLPDIGSLTPESDFSVFMREGVPAELRRLALRKLWTSDPVLANLDGLVDYGEDFTDIKSGVLEAVAEALDSEKPAAAAADAPEGGEGADAPREAADGAADEDGEAEETTTGAPADKAETVEDRPAGRGQRASDRPKSGKKGRG